MKRILVGGCAALLAVSCADDPAVYLGGPAGPTASINVSNGRPLVTVGGAAATVGVTAVDAVGNQTGQTVTATPCNGLVSVTSGDGDGLRWANFLTISAASTIGESCVRLSAGDATDSIAVILVPGSFRIVGPDTVQSGTSNDYSFEYYDANGTTLTPDASFREPRLQSLNEFVLDVTENTGGATDAAAAAPGSVILQAQLDPGDGALTARRPVVVVPGVYAGTRSVDAAAPEQAVVVKPAAGRAWDGDERVFLDDVPMEIWDGTNGGAITVTADSIVVYVPNTVAPGTYSMLVVSQGPTQIAELFTTDFTVNAGPYTVNNQAFPGSNTPGTGLAGRSMPNYFRVVLGPSTLGSRNSYYTITPSSDFIFTMQFETTGQDADIQVIDAAFAFIIDDRSGETLASKETIVWGVEGGEFNFIRFRNYDPVDAPGTVRMWDGCVGGLTNGNGDDLEDTDNWDDWC